ncbi:MAG: MFS transporter [Gammaproteobacteria bacterium]
MKADSMTGTERRASLSLAGIFSLRMLGLFMIYPVFAVWARRLPDATATTIGLALGIYGLTQALFQIPFGFLSDRIGRKRIIAAGLILFAIGSVVAALSHSIYGIIFGRLLQGAGAVGSAVLALAADLTREEHRTKAMAIIGMTIGASFGLAVVVGPILNGWIGVPGIFWLTAVLAVLGIGVLYVLVPQPVVSRVHREAEPVAALFKRVLTNRELLRLDFGIFVQHAILTASFLSVPFVLKQAGIVLHHQWYVYLPVLVVSILLMVPLIIMAERGRVKSVFLAAVALLAVSQLMLLFGHTSLPLVLLAILVFFTAFNLLESTLPSLISRVAPAEAKGTAMGVYSSSQFFGIFVGGALGGWLQGVWGLAGVFGLCSVLAGLWWLSALFMRPPGRVSSRVLRVQVQDESAASRLAEELRRIPGVLEAVVVPAEGVAYLRVGAGLDEAGLEAAVSDG